MKTLSAIILSAVVLIAGMGCGGLRRDRLVRAPQASAIVLKVKGSRILVAVEDAATGEIVEVGWVDGAEYEGWTLSMFDWNS